MTHQFSDFILIIGSMKSGTTTLFDYLSEHPEISQSVCKEPNFFASDVNFSKGMKWYRSLWRFDSNIHKFALDGSTHYTKIPHFPNAAERIASIDNANFKFIYIMRDPIERIESHYAHLVTSNTTKDECSHEATSIQIHPKMIDTSRYAMQIQQYYDRFPKDSILLLNFDDLKKEPLHVLMRTCDFLGINSDFKFSPLGRANQTKGKLKDGPLWKWVDPATTFLPQKPRNAVRKVFSQPLRVKYKLTDEQKDMVLKELREDLLKLKEELGFDISRWNLSL